MGCGASKQSEPLVVDGQKKPSLAKESTVLAEMDPKTLMFITAAKENNFKQLKQFAGIVDLNVKDSKGHTALMYACEHQNLEMVEYLLEKKNKGMKRVAINDQNPKGDTALHIAVQGKDTAIVAYLMDYGSKADVKNGKGKTPIDVATPEMKRLVQGEKKEEEEVPKAPQNPNIEGTDISPLEQKEFFSAAMSGELEEVKAFLTVKNIDIDLPDFKGWTILMCASQRGHYDIVKFLLDRNANVNAENGCQCSALHFAADVQIAKLLVEAGANIFLENEWGNKPEDFTVPDDVREYLKTVREGLSKEDSKESTEENDSKEAPEEPKLSEEQKPSTEPTTEPTSTEPTSESSKEPSQTSESTESST